MVSTSHPITVNWKLPVSLECHSAWRKLPSLKLKPRRLTPLYARLKADVMEGPDSIGLVANLPRGETGLNEELRRVCWHMHDTFHEFIFAVNSKIQTNDGNSLVLLSYLAGRDGYRDALEASLSAASGTSVHDRCSARLGFLQAFVENLSPEERNQRQAAAKANPAKILNGQKDIEEAPPDWMRPQRQPEKQIFRRTYASKDRNK